MVGTLVLALGTATAPLAHAAAAKPDSTRKARAPRPAPPAPKFLDMAMARMLADRGMQGHPTQPGPPQGNLGLPDTGSDSEGQVTPYAPQ